MKFPKKPYKKNVTYEVRLKNLARIMSSTRVDEEMKNYCVWHSTGDGWIRIKKSRFDNNKVHKVVYDGSMHNRHIFKIPYSTECFYDEWFADENEMKELDDNMFMI